MMTRMFGLPRLGALLPATGCLSCGAGCWALPWGGGAAFSCGVSCWASAFCVDSDAATETRSRPMPTRRTLYFAIIRSSGMLRGLKHVDCASTFRDSSNPDPRLAPDRREDHPSHGLLGFGARRGISGMIGSGG